MRKWYVLVLVIGAAIILAVGIFAKGKPDDVITPTKPISTDAVETEKVTTAVPETEKIAVSDTEPAASENTSPGTEPGNGETMESSSEPEFTEMEVIETIIDINENQSVGGL